MTIQDELLLATRVRVSNKPAKVKLPDRADPVRVMVPLGLPWRIWTLSPTDAAGIKADGAGTVTVISELWLHCTITDPNGVTSEDTIV